MVRIMRGTDTSGVHLHGQRARLRARGPAALGPLTGAPHGARIPVLPIRHHPLPGRPLCRLAFLLDPDRLNVAVTRAQVLATVVAAPGLLRVRCKTIPEMLLLNRHRWLARGMFQP